MVPEMIPKPKATVIRDRKGCHFRIEVDTIINTIDKNNRIINHITDER